MGSVGLVYRVHPIPSDRASPSHFLFSDLEILDKKVVIVEYTSIKMIWTTK